MPSEGDLKGSVYSAWDRGSKTAIHQNLSAEGVPAAAGQERRNYNDDSISLDSLQMQEESSRYSGAAYIPARELPGDYDTFKKEAHEPPRPSGPPFDVRVSRLSWLSVWLIILSVYSTILSGMWLGVAIAQPGWGRTISSGGSLDLSTANVLTAIFSKTIELSFVTVFVAFIGQVLTRRAIATNAGMTMAEMTMRTWITVSLPSNHAARRCGTRLTFPATWVAIGKWPDSAIRWPHPSWHLDPDRDACCDALHHSLRHDGPAQAPVQRMG